MPEKNIAPDWMTRVAQVAAAAADKGVLARVAPAVEDVHLEIDGQRWVVWPVNGWWATRLDNTLSPVEDAGYIGPGDLAAEEVVDRAMHARLTVSPFDDTPLVRTGRSDDR